MTTLHIMGQVEIDVDLRLQPGEADAVAASCLPHEAAAIDLGDVEALLSVLGRVRLERAIGKLPGVRSCSISSGDQVIEPFRVAARAELDRRGLLP